MSRAIDGETLYERACDLEAQALAYVGKIANDETKIEEWKIWSAILVERTAFKHDIFDAPEVKPEPHWIPCSERLPEEYGEYRITWTTSASNKRFVGDSEYEVTDAWDADHYRFKGEWLLDDYVKNYPDVKVIAWKPLEEPYAERRTDDR